MCANVAVDISIRPLLSLTNDGNAAKRQHSSARIAQIIGCIENVIYNGI